MSKLKVCCFIVLFSAADWASESGARGLPTLSRPLQAGEAQTSARPPGSVAGGADRQPAGFWWSSLSPLADTLRSALVNTVRGQLGPGAKLGDAEIVQAYPPILSVRDLDLPLTEALDGPRLIVAMGRLAISPARSGAPTMGELSAPLATVTAPKSLTVKNLTARIWSGAMGLAVQHFEASVHGGSVSGSLTPNKGTAPRLLLKMAGISMAAATGRPGRERLTATMEGSLPGRLEDLTAVGRATITGLTVDLTNDSTLRSMQAKARRGQQASEVVDTLIGDDSLRSLAGAFTGAGQASFYRGLIVGLRRRHNLGSAGGPLRITKGVATIMPLAGASIGGKVTMNLMTTRLSGYLSRVRLGRVTLQSVTLSGTAGNPGYSVNQNRILVDGRRPSAGGAPSIPASIPIGILDRVLGGASRDQGGNRLLRGLLGGF